MSTNSPILDLPDDAALVRHMNAAAGYLELAMPAEALEELQLAGREHEDLPGVLHLSLICLMSLECYEEAMTLSLRAIRCHRTVPEFYIHGGAALGAMGRNEDARQLWLTAPDGLRDTGFFHYNLAFCELAMGDAAMARLHLRRAIELDPRVKEFVEGDPDMDALLTPAADEGLGQTRLQPMAAV